MEYNKNTDAKECGNRVRERRMSSNTSGSSGLIPVLLSAVPLLVILFYGLIGPDKVPALAPIVMIGCPLIGIWFLKDGIKGSGTFSISGALLLLILFAVYGISLVPSALLPYEAKFRMILVISVIGYFGVWSNTQTTFRLNRAFLAVLILYALALAVYGLVIHFKCPERILWTERYAPYVGRLCSTYICPNHFAHFLQMLLPFCLVLVFIPQAGIYLRVLSGYSLLMFLPPLFFTESRAGWLGSFAAIGVTVCLLALRKSKTLFCLLILIVPLLGAGALVGAWHFSETFKKRMTPVVKFLEGQAQEGIGSESKDFRPQTWKDTLDMIKDRPLTGFGPGNYDLVFPEYRTRFKGRRFRTGHPHNEYLEIAADYGLIGLGLMAVAWIYALIRLFVFTLKTPHRHHALIGTAFIGTAAGTLVHSFFDFQMHVVPNALVFVFLAAVAMGPIRHQSKLPELKVLNRSAAILLGICFLAAGGWGIQVMSSALFRFSGDRAVEENNSAKAEKRYTQAAKIDSGNWMAYAGLGALAYDERYYSVIQDEKPSLAKSERAWFEMAYAMNAREPDVLYGLARVLIFQGEQEWGLNLMRTLAGYKRFNDYYQWRLGVSLREAGLYEESLDYFRRSKRLKNTASTRRNIQWVEEQLGLREAAKQNVRKETESAGSDFSLESMFQGLQEPSSDSSLKNFQQDNSPDPAPSIDPIRKTSDLGLLFEGLPES